MTVMQQTRARQYIGMAVYQLTASTQHLHRCVRRGCGSEGVGAAKELSGSYLALSGSYRARRVFVLKSRSQVSWHHVLPLNFTTTVISLSISHDPDVQAPLAGETSVKKPP